MLVGDAVLEPVGLDHSSRVDPGPDGLAGGW